MLEEITIVAVTHANDAIRVDLTDGSYLFVKLDELMLMGVPRLAPSPGEDFAESLRRAIDEIKSSGSRAERPPHR